MSTTKTVEIVVVKLRNDGTADRPRISSERRGLIRVSDGAVTFETDDEHLRQHLQFLFRDGPVVDSRHGGCDDGLCYEYDVPVGPADHGYANAVGANLPFGYDILD